MAVVPVELNRVLADWLGGHRLRSRFIDAQFVWSVLRGLTRLPIGLHAFFVAQSAGAGIPQMREAVVRDVPIFPLDRDTLAGREMNFDRLRISRHEIFSIAEKRLTRSGLRTGPALAELQEIR